MKIETKEQMRLAEVKRVVAVPPGRRYIIEEYADQVEGDGVAKERLREDARRSD